MKKPLIKNGSRKPRKERPKSKDIVPGYDSIWEYVLHSGLLSDWSFHTETISYEIPHTYHPDFIKEIKSKTIY